MSSLPVDSSISLVTHLYRHALESMFAFLSLGELHTVIAVSVDWRSAVDSMRAIRAELGRVWRPSLHFPLVCASRLARHVDDVTMIRVCTSELFRIFSDRMPHLRSLALHELNLDSSDLVLPRKLRSLTIRLQLEKPVMDRLCTALEQLEGLTELNVESLLDFKQLDMPPFTRLPALRSLTLALRSYSAAERARPSPAQIELLRSMSYLDRMCITHAVESLPALLGTPHQIQWRSMSTNTRWLDLDDETAAALQSLPSLTDLFTLFSGSHADWLHALPNLTLLDLETNLHAPPEPLMAGLRSCTRLTDFKIIWRSLQRI